MTAVIANVANASKMHGSVDSNIYNNSMAVGPVSNNSLTVNNGNRSGSANRNVKYLTRMEPSGPLQLHHVLPTLQPSEEYYRTAATSPFPLTSNSISDPVSDVSTVLHQSNSSQIPEIIVSQQASNTPIQNAQNERGLSQSDADLRRSHHRSYDEFDSDDELRREEISFTNDGK